MNLKWIKIACLCFAIYAPALAIDGDINKDGEVNFADYLLLVKNFGTSGPVDADTVFVTRRDTLTITREIIRSTGIQITGSSADLYLFYGSIEDTLYIVRSGLVDSVIVISSTRATNIGITGSSADVNIVPMDRPLLVIPNRENDVVLNSEVAVRDIKWAFTETVANFDGTITVKGQYALTFVVSNSPLPNFVLRFVDALGMMVREVQPGNQSSNSVSVSASSVAVSYTTGGSFALIASDQTELQKIVAMEIGFR